MTHDEAVETLTVQPRWWVWFAGRIFGEHSVSWRHWREAIYHMRREARKELMRREMEKAARRFSPRGRAV